MRCPKRSGAVCAPCAGVAPARGVVCQPANGVGVRVARGVRVGVGVIGAGVIVAVGDGPQEASWRVQLDAQPSGPPVNPKAAQLGC